LLPCGIAFRPQEFFSVGNIVSLFEKTRWQDIVSFDLMFDATIEPVTVTKK
jgi:hypothetical protein